MVRQLLLVGLMLGLGLSITVNINGCSCDEVLKEDECDNYYGRQCVWDAEKKICEDPIRQDCPFLTQYGQNTCHRDNECAWVGGKCVDFTKCTDYKESVDDKCNNININCVTIADGKCGQIRKPDCETLEATSAACTADSDGRCAIYGTPPAPPTCVKMNSCEKGSYNQAQCNKNLASCAWVQNACRDKTCADITSKDSCKYVLTFDGLKATLCHWTAEGKCVDGEEDHYTEENCFTESAYDKIWYDGKCRSCSNSIILSIAIIFMALF